MVFGLSVLNRIYNFYGVCPEQGMVSTIVIIIMAYTVFAILYQRGLLVFETLYYCAKQKSAYFVLCVKQGPKTEGVVLHNVGILGLFLP